MGCALSSMRRKRHVPVLGGRNDAVWVCRERKRLVKKAVKKRQAFADAHFKYFHSLSAVSSALSLFIARYSSSSSSSSPQFDVAFPDSTPQSHSQPSKSQSSAASLVSSEDDGVHHPVDWDFFNLLEETKVKNKEAEREFKGGGKEDKQHGNGNGNRNGRELLDALKDVEDHFVRAFHSGIEVSRMLEVDKFDSHLSSQYIQENACRKRSIPSRTSSCKSLLSSSSRSTTSTCTEGGGDRKSLLSSSSDASSMYTEYRSDPADGHWGMASGSHSSTLGRLYAWEKKLYNEVKAGDQIRKAYKQKCSQLPQKNVEGDDLCPSKSASEVMGMYHLMLVALQRAESISLQIDKLRDEELQPQLLELLQGLMRTWKSMWEIHEIQKKTMCEIRSFSSPDLEKSSNGSYHLATLQLEAVMQNWQSCFSEYVSAQKAYVKSLHGWLSKFIDAEAEYYHKGSSSLPPIIFNGPTLLVTCHNWLTSLERLPDEAVKNAMKSLAKDIQGLWVQQGINQKQRLKVDALAKEMDRKLLTLEKAEDKSLIVRSTAQNNLKDRVESFDERKNRLEMFSKKLEMEKDRYHNSSQQVERTTIERLQMGFSSVFESLADFSRASVKVYADLVAFSQNANIQEGQAFVCSSKDRKRSMGCDSTST